MVVDKLRKELMKKSITYYKLSQMTNIKYELLRRVFNGNRKLSADELLLILDKTSISFEDIK